jgi:hypothetical protein
MQSCLTIEQEKHRKKDGLMMKFKSFMKLIKKEMRQALPRMRNARNSCHKNSQD